MRSNNQNNDSVKCYSRLRRGMIFYYDPDPSVDKNNVSPVVINGQEHKDFIIKGKRPWVVVSSEEVCIKCPVVQVVPLHSSPKQIYTNDVEFVFKGQTAAIKCEQIRSVNADELREYDCILDDCVMDKIDICLSRMLGLKEVTKEVNQPITSASMGQITQIIQAVVDKQVAAAKAEVEKTKVASDVDVEDAVLRISEGIANLFDTPLSLVPESNDLPEYEPEETKPRTQYKPIKPLAPVKRTKTLAVVDRVKYRYGTKSMRNITPVREVGDTHHCWTDDECIEFLHDCEEYNMNSIMKKYGCSTTKELTNLRYRITKKMSVTV